MARSVQKKVKQNSKSGIRRRFGFLLKVTAVIFVLAFVFLFLQRDYFDRESMFESDITINVPSGANLRSVSEDLAAKGVISNEMAFKLLAYYRGVENALKAGEFEIPAHSSMNKILNILTDSTSAVVYKVTFPEGLTSWQIVQKLNETKGLTGSVDDIPPEGSIAPSTFTFERGDDRAKILELARSYQSAYLKEAWEGREEGLPLSSPEEMLILASIVEKETGNATERPMVASVFINRLLKGMRLETDPTVIYGITLGQKLLGRGLKRSELSTPTPYNTYIIEGLPPTPISNPGKAALEAVAHPAKTEFLYFVAKSLDPSDGHNFAETYEEHEKNVAAYRALEDAAN